MRSKKTDAVDKHASLNFAIQVIHENILNSRPMEDLQIEIAEIFSDHYMELFWEHKIKKWRPKTIS